MRDFPIRQKVQEDLVKDWASLYGHSIMSGRHEDQTWRHKCKETGSCNINISCNYCVAIYANLTLLRVSHESHCSVKWYLAKTHIGWYLPASRPSSWTKTASIRYLTQWFAWHSNFKLIAYDNTLLVSHNMKLNIVLHIHLRQRFEKKTERKCATTYTRHYIHSIIITCFGTTKSVV